MAEYIERRALFNRLADYWNIPRDWDGGIAQPCEDALTIIEDFPAADVAPVRHGRWVKDGDFLICLNCESEINIKNSLGVENHKNYCPNCGCKMEVSDG